MQQQLLNMQNEGIRQPKLILQQAAVGSRGPGGRINTAYSAVEVVLRIDLSFFESTVSYFGQHDHPLKATLSNQSMN